MNAFPKTATDRKVIPTMRGLGACYVGRRGMPRDWVLAMYADYQAGMSLADVGQKHGRTRQSMFDIFKRRGLKLRAKKFLKVVEYKGRKYTCQKICGRHRYLRDTINGRTSQDRKTKYLHHVIWMEHNGPIPAGHKVVFSDGDHLNWDIRNLELMTNSDQVKRHATGHNQFTKHAPARLASLLQGRGTGLAQLRRTR